MAGGLSAQDEDPGHFEVREASDELRNGTYFVNAQIYLRLSSEATEALHSRVALTIRIEVEFLNRLWFWLDNAEFSRVRRSTLIYYPLTERYVVTNIIEAESDDEDGFIEVAQDREDFVTLAGALEFIGRIDRLPIVEETRLDEDLRYDVRVRAVLDKRDLPGALRFRAFFGGPWSIGSDWFEWRLDD